MKRESNFAVFFWISMPCLGFVISLVRKKTQSSTPNKLSFTYWENQDDSNISGIRNSNLSFGILFLHPMKMMGI